MAEKSAQDRGSGTTIEDPFCLDAMHPVAGELFEIQIISNIFGKENQDWFHHWRLLHPNKVREWQIRLNSGQKRRIFFDESRFTYSIPLPDRARAILEEAAATRPVPDATLISRFPLIEVRAKSAADAARLVLTHVNQARSQGWTKGNTHLFVDGWRFDQELFRGSEKTVMMFDMRPVKAHLSGIDLATFYALDSFEAIDQVERRVKESNAAKTPFAARGLRFNWKPLLVTITKFGSIAAATVSVITLVASRSLVTSVELAAAAFGIIAVWFLCEALQVANMSPAESWAERCKVHLRLKYSDTLRHLYPQQDIVNEYVQYIEGTPRDAARWTLFTNDGVITGDSFERLEQSFEDWLKRSSY